ncbi:MAG TPA: FUSC family protein, partial [Paraburkholderia sp.]|nr:FUSC family protein [Paraburkholderia sp.]
QVIDVWQDCRSLRIIITREEGSWRPRFRHWRLGGTERFFDRGIMLFSATSAAAAVIIACTLWIGSGWADGASAVTLAAVACCFFAALDEPAPMVFRFFVATAIAVVAAGLYLFVVLPHVHEFAMLVILFAAPFILVGTLMPRPQFNLVTVLVAVNTATFISIQEAYSADFLIFMNSNLAGLAGLLYAYLWTRVTRPFGAELAASRLLRSSWADVALTASTRTIDDPRNLAARMLDRLMQLIPRLAATDDHRHPSIESFRDLRIAFNALDLRRLTARLGGDAPAAIAHVLEDVQQYFESCIDLRRRQPVPQSLMSSIDAAVARVTAQGVANADAPSATSATSARQLRDALHALVGLRLSLFPATLIIPTPPVPEAAA